MQLTIKDSQDVLTVSEVTFASAFNEALVHQVVVAYQAGARQGSRAQKTRAEVAGTGRKPWKQKKTGNARAGDAQSPIWRSGGVTFAAKPQDHSQKVNKKMYRGAMRSIISELVRQDRLVVVKEIKIEQPKTKLLVSKLKSLDLDSVLMVDTAIDFNLCLASNNLYKVGYLLAKELNPTSLLSYNKVLVTESAVKEIEEMFQ